MSMPTAAGVRRNKDELKQTVLAAIDRRRDEIIGIGEGLRRHPELGFKEVKTARVVEETFWKLGLNPAPALLLPAFGPNWLDVAAHGLTLALMGELDALVVSGHPEADP